jgi:hypothetical protein
VQPVNNFCKGPMHSSQRELILDDNLKLERYVLLLSFSTNWIVARTFFPSNNSTPKRNIGRKRRTFKSWVWKRVNKIQVSRNWELVNPRLKLERNQK